MIGFLLSVPVFLGSSAVGLLVASLIVPGVTLRPLGFITAVVIFTVAQGVLSPFFLRMASRYASAFLGGIGLVSTLAALALASIFSNGINIRGISSWITATVLVWLVTSVATLAIRPVILRLASDTSTTNKVPQPAGYTKDGQPIYPIVGYTSDGNPVTADNASDWTPASSSTNTMAIVSLIMAIVFPLLGAVLGHVSIAQIHRTGEQGKGLALAALVISYLSLTISVVAVVALLLT